MSIVAHGPLVAIWVEWLAFPESHATHIMVSRMGDRLTLWKTQLNLNLVPALGYEMTPPSSPYFTYRKNSAIRLGFFSPKI